MPFYPKPTAEQIDDIIARLCKGLELPFTVESDAKLLWRQRVGIAAVHHADQGGRDRRHRDELISGGR